MSDTLTTNIAIHASNLIQPANVAADGDIKADAVALIGVFIKAEGAVAVVTASSGFAPSNATVVVDPFDDAAGSDTWKFVELVASEVIADIVEVTGEVFLVVAVEKDEAEEEDIEELATSATTVELISDFANGFLTCFESSFSFFLLSIAAAAALTEDTPSSKLPFFSMAATVCFSDSLTAVIVVVVIVAFFEAVTLPVGSTLVNILLIVA